MYTLYCFRELTIGQSSSFSVNPSEKCSGPLRVIRGPELLEHIESLQCLEFRPFRPVLFIPKPSLHPRGEGQTVWIVDRVRLGALNVSVRVVEAAFSGKQVGQGAMDPKQFAVPNAIPRAVPKQTLL